MGIPVVISAVVSDAVGVTSCTYALDTVDHGAMMLGNGMAQAKYSFINVGDHSIIVFCADAANNVGKSTEMFIRVSEKKDALAPIVGTLPPVQAIAGSPVTVSTTYSDNVGVTVCTVYLDAVDAGAMALANGMATSSITVSKEGSHTLYVGCVDAAGNVGASPSATTIDVVATTGDLTVPTIGSISPVVATQNSTVTFTVSVSDDSGVSQCHLFIDGADQGGMKYDAATQMFSRYYTFAHSGTFPLYADCADTVGNHGTGPSTDVVVAVATETKTDVIAPSVGIITPTTAIATIATTLSAAVDDSVGVVSCELYVDSVDVGAMTVANGTASFLYTFATAGTAAANAYCKDAAGNAGRGSSSYIIVEDASAAIVPVAEVVSNTDASADPGNLIKLACYSNSDVNDPCKAVYYYGATDGMRHVFPSEGAFMTWFVNFDDVVIVSDDFMQSIPLGTSVVYRPGARLVKFESLKTVYAVTKGGVLRAIDSEETAASIYGKDWNTLVDVISDAFFSKYHFGEPITDATGYDPDAEKEAVKTIDANLE